MNEQYRIQSANLALEYIQDAKKSQWTPRLRNGVRAALLMWQECPRLTPYPESEAYALKFDYFFECLSAITTP